MTSLPLLSLNNKRPAVKRGGGIKLLRPCNPLVYVRKRACTGAARRGARGARRARRQISIKSNQCLHNSPPAHKSYANARRASARARDAPITMKTNC
ncbi:hypothetical protein EVAR_67581_1 [Eumeta japonica]|uniref:Uncharacterized protein n=1 Tax=Eumeta variegata TaxID=151549 RepID=A0A4C2A7I4_EUMVA|nr:hypothetical protein EVAR_67581_1 [Eumeta japonica]